MKKLKAFTLIELIVVIVIFGIIMTGVVQMIAPISSAATNAKVLNNQQTVENAMSMYVGENLRYANNLLVVEQGCSINGKTVNSAETAIDAFFAFTPVNSAGKVFDNSPANRLKVNVIAFESAVNRTGTGEGDAVRKGRLISSLGGRTAGTLDFTQTESDGSKNQYIVFGNSFYGPALYDMYVTMDNTNHTLNLQVTSEYHYSNSKKSGVSDTSKNTKNGKSTYELRNYGVGGYMFKLVRKTGGAGDGIGSSTRSTGNTIYFVYIDEHNVDSMTTDPSLSAGASPALSGCEEKYGKTASNKNDTSK